MSDSETDESKPTQLIIARWSDRFFAWLIDGGIVMVGFFCSLVNNDWIAKS